MFPAWFTDMAHSLLLVESHDDSREMYRYFLEFCGFNVITAATVCEAVKAIPNVDVAVVAAQGERKNGGLALVRWSRLRESTARLPIVVISTGAREHDVAKATSAGCDVFLTKPCPPRDLVRSIRWTLAWTRRGRPMIEASTRLARLACVRAVPGHYLARQ
jgi:DNA-binding response OmpR family regulator